MPVSARPLVLVVAAVAASFSVALWWSWEQLGPVDRSTRALAADVTPTLRRLSEARTRLHHVHAAAADCVFGIDEGVEAAGPCRERLVAAREELHAAVASYLELPFLPGEQELFARVGPTLASLDDSVELVLAAADAGDPPAAHEALEQRVARATLAADEALGALIRRDLDGADEDVSVIQEARVHAGTTALTLGAASLTLALLTSLVAFRSLSQQADRDRALTHALALQEVAREEVRRRDEFLTVASHELRTPLTSLLLAVQTMARGAPTPRTLEVIERQARHLARLVDELLDVTRIEQGSLTMVREDADLADIVREAVGPVARAGCRVDMCATGDVRGRWDRRRIGQVAAHLLSNAARFGAGKPVSVVVAADGDGARLTVTDAGIGIPAERLPRIFERFERGVSANHYGGLGLGLYVTRHIVEAHGGTICVASVPGEGTTFVVELPIAEGGEAPSHATPTSATPRPGWGWPRRSR